MVFSILVWNEDDHAKNHSCFRDGHRWKLMPARDYFRSDVQASWVRDRPNKLCLPLLHRALVQIYDMHLKIW